MKLLLMHDLYTFLHWLVIPGMQITDIRLYLSYQNLTKQSEIAGALIICLKEIITFTFILSIVLHKALGISLVI
jgi:hypothetical protein